MACHSSGHKSNVVGALGLGLERLQVGWVPALAGALALRPSLFLLLLGREAARSSPPAPYAWWGSGARGGGCSQVLV